METQVVAVVDGRHMVHDFVVETLQAAGYTVHGYLSRATFLVDAPTLQPWIVLLGADDDAFDVDTALVIRSLHTARHPPKMPIILYSADAHAAQREQVEGMEEVLPLPVPFTAERLLEAVRAVMDDSAKEPVLTQ